MAQRNVPALDHIQAPQWTGALGDDPRSRHIEGEAHLLVRGWRRLKPGRRPGERCRNGEQQDGERRAPPTVCRRCERRRDERGKGEKAQAILGR